MRTILLIRHAEAVGQDANDGLTALGVDQASALAELLASDSIDRIVSSPYLRAVETAQPLATRLGLPIETDHRLVERVLCGEPRTDWRDLLAASFDNLETCWPGGESSRTAMDRVNAVIRDALNREAATTVLVTHGCLLTLALKSLDGKYGFAEWQALKCPDVYRVRVSAERIVIDMLDVPLKECDASES